MATPIILNSPQISIGGIDLKCHARQVSLTPDQEFVDISTFCNPGGEAPGQASWTLSLTGLQSFDGTDGLYNQLQPLEGTNVAFEVTPDDTAAVSATNPKASGTVYVPLVPFIDAGVGEATELSMDFKVIGQPTVAFAP